MPRINIYDYSNENEPARVGHFTTEAATLYQEETRWDGDNHISVNPVGRFGHQALWRTKGGRWVLNTWSQYRSVKERHELVDDDTAKDWLLRNDHDDAVEQHFGDVAEEEGPRLGGRPEIGPKVETRLPDDDLARVKKYAKQTGRSRADALRHLITAGLDAEEPA